MTTLLRPRLSGTPNSHISVRRKLAGARRWLPPSPLTNQPACKPGSVWRKADALRVTAIPLERRLPGASSNLPGRQDLDTYLGARRLAAMRPTPSLFGLAPGGVCRAASLPPARCALTAPFHPCRVRAERVGGLFLWHFPSSCLDRTLSGTCFRGARTFLPGGLSALAGAAVRPTDAESNGVRGARRQGEQRRRRMGRAERNPSRTFPSGTFEEGFAPLNPSYKLY